MTGHVYAEVDADVGMPPGVLVECERCGLLRIAGLAASHAAQWAWASGRELVSVEPVCLGDAVEALSHVEWEVYVQLVTDGTVPPLALDLARLVVAA